MAIDSKAEIDGPPNKSNKTEKSQIGDNKSNISSKKSNKEKDFLKQHEVSSVSTRSNQSKVKIGVAEFSRRGTPIEQNEL